MPYNNNYPFGGRADRNPKPDKNPRPALDKVQKWIVNGVDPDTIIFAEEAGKYMAAKKLTTSQIRNIYGEIKRIQIGDFEKERSSFYLLKPKVAYAVTRQNNDGLKFFQDFFNEAYPAIETKQHFDHFCELMEAMLAYHKANNGK